MNFPPNTIIFSRRRFLKHSALVAPDAIFAASPFKSQASQSQYHLLSFCHTHTGETLDLNFNLNTCRPEKAKKSLHMEGRAIDIRLTDVPTEKLRTFACSMQQGGVGYYPESNFIHLDTGRVRTW